MAPFLLCTQGRLSLASCYSLLSFHLCRFSVVHLKQHKSMEQSSSGQVRSLRDFGRRACRFNEVRRRRREKRWKVEKSKRIRETFCAGERAVIA